MPYKDPDKRREARRKSDKKRSKFVGEIWSIIVYPDSAPEDWKDIFDELHLPVVISPIHDRDKNPDGTTKKPHYHVPIHFESKKSLEQVSELSEKLNSPIPMKQDSWRGICRYCCHLDNPEKAQYDPSDVVCLGGADYLAIVGAASDKYEVIREVMAWITEPENIKIHRWAFANVLAYAEKNNEKWFRGLCDNCGWTIQAFLKSSKWATEEEVRKAGEKKNVDA